MPCTKHCSLCGKPFKGNFQDVMAKLRRHRKQSHPKAHRESVKKALKTKGYDPLKTRSKMINKPTVTSFTDYRMSGLIRILRRADASYYPEFTLYPRKKGIAYIIGSLTDAGLKQEEKGKWVLRTNKFSIFVYL